MNETHLPASLCVLGSTGTVGVQTLDVARACGIPVCMLSGGKNVALMEQQARAFAPALVVMADEQAAADLAGRLADTSVRVRGGSEAICDGVRSCGADTVVNAILGQAGLLPTLAAAESCRRLALSNKESLVIAGALVRAACEAHGCELIPVDSEHSAIYQCLASSRPSDVRRLLLTASGGPFFGYTPEQLRSVTVEQTLGHPTWKMGNKITVDSATMMNKGFEIIEAVHLFGVPEDRVRVLIHRESIIHSAVEYIDNAVIAQLALPDMRTCIAYALTSPARVDCGTSPLDLTRIGRLTFAEPDAAAFPLPDLARRAIRAGGALPAVLNAANEEAVAAFLARRIGFADITRVVTDTVSAAAGTAPARTALPDVLACAAEGREDARRRLNALSKGNVRP